MAEPEPSGPGPAEEVAPAAHGHSAAKPPIGRGRRILLQVIIWATLVLAVLTIFAT